MEEQMTTESSIKSLAESLAARFDADASEFLGDFTLQIKPDQILQVLQVLRDEENFEMLADETAVDHWPEQTPRFYLSYQMRSISRNLLLMVRVPLDGNEPVANSATSVYPNADWYERELWDLFGIRFEGHPDLRRIMMPHDWVGHPLRKDYPLGYEEPQFTFNYDQIQARKLNPKE